MKISTFWDIALYSPLKVDCRFGETCFPHLLNRREAKQAENCLLNVVFFFLNFLFNLEDGGDVSDSKTLAEFLRTTQCHDARDKTRCFTFQNIG
jgi:phenylalanyl-tRNA synthetase alpha subunit